MGKWGLILVVLMSLGICGCSEKRQQPVSEDEVFSSGRDVEPSASDKMNNMGSETESEDEPVKESETPTVTPASSLPESTESTTAEQVTATTQATTTSRTETTAQQETTPPAQAKQTQTDEDEFIAYDPYEVERLSNEKVKAAGKILLPENLDMLLAEGKITQEEYDEYYPFDGCGYYSVFVETNLAIASTISLSPLESVEEIADYIAGMLALETGPYVCVDYEGVYSHNGNEFYEFRCYR